MDALRSLERRALLARAKNITESTRGLDTLVLAPHPDDEALGCGGTIAVKRGARAKVTVCFATDGEQSSRSRTLGAPKIATKRRQEALAACGALGVGADDVRFFAFGDGNLGRAGADLAATIAGVIDEIEPAELLIPTEIDWHEDHRALAAAALVAVEHSSVSPSILAYPVWFWNRASWVDPRASRTRQRVQTWTRPLSAIVHLQPRVVHVSTVLHCKEAALDAYAEELAQFGPSFRDRFLEPQELLFNLSAGSSSAE